MGMYMTICEKKTVETFDNEGYFAGRIDVWEPLTDDICVTSSCRAFLLSHGFITADDIENESFIILPKRFTDIKNSIIQYVRNGNDIQPIMNLIYMMEETNNYPENAISAC